MAPLVVPAVVRFSIHAELLGQECINIVDASITNISPGISREEAAFEVAGDIMNNWDDHVMGNLVGDYVATSVDWVDLDALDGSTGSRSSTDDTTWPASGRATGNACPGHTYARMRKNLVGSSRNSRRGILRLSGLSEDYVSGNNLLSSAVTSLNNAFEAFKDGINGAIEDPGTVNLVVVHVPAVGEPSSDNIATYTADSIVGTLRRRMPGYGE